MLDKIKALLFEGGFRPGSEARFSEKDIAVTVLLLEAAAADGNHDAAELSRIEALVTARLTGHDGARAKALLAEAGRRQLQAVEVFRFTDAAKRNLNEDERIGLVEMLWEVVYADGGADAFEDRIVRKIAGLLHVGDRDRGLARQRVLARRQQTE
jgi:uncharacterized tellurite resistance protein B-like protein